MDASALQGLTRTEIQKLAKTNGIKANLKTSTIIELLLSRNSDGVPRTPRVSQIKRSQNPSPAIPPSAMKYVLKTPQAAPNATLESASASHRPHLTPPILAPDHIIGQVPEPIVGPETPTSQGDCVANSNVPIPAWMETWRRGAFYTIASAQNAEAGPSQQKYVLKTPQAALNVTLESASASHRPPLTPPNLAPDHSSGQVPEPIVEPETPTSQSDRVANSNAPNAVPAWMEAWRRGALYTIASAQNAEAGPSQQFGASVAQPEMVGGNPHADQAPPRVSEGSSAPSYVSYESGPEVKRQPSPKFYLIRAVRSMQRLSERHHQRYQDAANLSKAADTMLLQVQALRKRVAQEKAMRLRALNFITYYQKKAPEWTDEELFDRTIRTVSEKGRIRELDSDEEYEAARTKSSSGKASRGSRKAPIVKAKLPEERVIPVNASTMLRLQNFFQKRAAPVVNDNGKRPRPAVDAEGDVRKRKMRRADEDRGIRRMDKGKGRMVEPGQDARQNEGNADVAMEWVLESVPEVDENDIAETRGVLHMLNKLLLNHEGQKDQPVVQSSPKNVMAGPALPTQPVRRSSRVRNGSQLPSGQRNSKARPVSSRNRM